MNSEQLINGAIGVVLGIFLTIILPIMYDFIVKAKRRKEFKKVESEPCKRVESEPCKKLEFNDALSEMRELVSHKAQNHRAEIKAKINTFGANRIRELDPENFPEMLNFLRKL